LHRQCWQQSTRQLAALQADRIRQEQEQREAATSAVKADAVVLATSALVLQVAAGAADSARYLALGQGFRAESVRLATLGRDLAGKITTKQASINAHLAKARAKDLLALNSLRKAERQGKKLVVVDRQLASGRW
jgi:hypothetical protein